jgi:COP9 signalosome complex subunit 4
MDRVLRSEEVMQFEAHLKPHHIEKRGDGFSGLPARRCCCVWRVSDGPCADVDAAMVQHNLLAASRIYNNITFEQMGGLLQVAPEKVRPAAGVRAGGRRADGGARAGREGCGADDHGQAPCGQHRPDLGSGDL